MPFPSSHKPYSHKWHHDLIRWAYSLLLFLLLPLALLKLLAKADKTEGESNKNRERFGFLGPKKQGGILIHCVSMGEVNAAKKLVDELKVLYPLLPITLSTTSTTGAKHARGLFGDSVQHCFLAIDLPLCMRLFFNKLKPSMVLITEVEIWPNMLHQCYKRGIPTVLVNARMSANSVSNYRKLAWLFRPTLRKFTLICAQGSKDFDRFLTLGVYKHNLKLTNNMKFDLQVEEKDEVLATELRDQLDLRDVPIFVAGSTHDSEELICLDTFKKLRSSYSDLVLVLVPRHPHRFDKVVQICDASGFTTLRVSDMKNRDMPSVIARPDILVVDAMGLLKACFRLANIAFVGGSFVERGGHNPIEPALYAVPTAMGPSNFNNPAICEALADSGGLRIVTSSNALIETYHAWLANEADRCEAGLAAQSVLTENAGAVDSTLACIKSVIPATLSSPRKRGPKT